MKVIALSHDRFARVDDEDYDRIINSGYKWYAVKHGYTWYAHGYKRINKKPYRILMHRLILNPPDRFEVDHINHNGLDNQRSNLRIATRSLNVANQIKHKKSKTKYKGVKLTPFYKFRATIYVNHRSIDLGTYETAEEAAQAYNIAATKYYGEFACLNEIKY